MERGAYSWTMNPILNYVSPRQLHERWGLHEESVRRILREGRIPAIRIGKRLRVALPDVEAYEAARRIIPPVRHEAP